MHEDHSDSHRRSPRGRALPSPAGEPTQPAPAEGDANGQFCWRAAARAVSRFAKFRQAIASTRPAITHIVRSARRRFFISSSLTNTTRTGLRSSWDVMAANSASAPAGARPAGRGRGLRGSGTADCFRAVGAGPGVRADRSSERGRTPEATHRPRSPESHRGSSRPANDGRIGREPAAPESVTDQHNRRVARLEVRGFEVRPTTGLSVESSPTSVGSDA